MGTGRAFEDLFETCLALGEALFKAFGELLELAGLEARIALRSLVKACVLLLVALFLLSAAFLLGEAALITGLRAAGLPLWGALVTALGVNCVGLWAIGRWRRALLSNLRFSATRRQIAHLATRPVYGDPGPAP
jgi:hypothetical protein